MISELNNDEILEILMCSDFNDDYKPEEFKYLLFKWRYFYRILHGNKELLKSEKEGEIRKLKEEVKSLNSTIGSLLVESDKKDSIIKDLIERKLSFKERVLGKLSVKIN
jgi:hypothetical protein